MKTTLSSLMAAAVSLAMLASTAVAQTPYPNAPVTWIVPFTAGGPTDALARVIAQRVSQEVGQNILIENVPGAGGTLGAARVAQAQPDGYTFLVGHVGYMAAAPAMYAKLPYDPIGDFKPVFRFPDTPLVLMVNKDSPFNTVAELIAHAKENPEDLMFSNAGVGSTSHLVAAMFATEADIVITPIPYPGAGPALNDLVGAQVDAMFDQTNTALPQVRSGQVKALGITSLDPNEQFPGVDPIGKDAVDGFDASTWYGIYAPAGTPDEMIDAMYSAYTKAMADEAFTTRLAEQAIVLLTNEQYAPGALGEHTAAEIERWGAVIRDANISLD